MKKVTIIIPIYNVADYIENCLSSVEEQTYENLEVILVDDCGTDESITIAEKYLARPYFPNAKIIKLWML